MNTIHMIVGAAVLTATVTTAQARPAYDPMRCEATMLQRESRLHKCMSKCERKVANRPNFDANACDETCNTRFAGAIERLQHRAVCSPPTADRHQCEAQALKVEARHLICEAGCERKGQGKRSEFDVEECNTSCDTRSATGLDEVLSSPVCAEGRAKEDAPVGEESAAE